MIVKNKFKIFSMLFLILLALILCSNNAVLATDITKVELQTILDKIPETIETDKILSTPDDYWQWTSDVGAKVQTTIGDVEGIHIETTFVRDTNTGIIDLSKVTVSLSDSNYANELSKTITIKCSNWNENDKKHIEEKLNSLNLKDESYHISANLDLSEDTDSTKFFSSVSQNHFDKLLNDSSIKTELGSTTGDWGDGVYACYSGQMFFSMNNVMYYMYPHVSVEGIPVEVIETADKTTNVSLNADTSIIPSNTVLEVKEVKSGEAYNTITESLKNVSNKFMAYDITLKSDGVEIQPNGNVQISLPIPSGYDTGKVVVFRVETDGTIIKYDTKIENNYAIIETDHFSNYVIAEQNVSSTTETDKTPIKKGEKDDKPKTGTIQYIGLAVIVVALSSIGIIALRNKKH